MQTSSSLGLPGALILSSLLVACGGGGSDSGALPAAQPLVSSGAAGTPRYSQSLLLTLIGVNLDSGVTVTSAGCSNIVRSTTAPIISTAAVAYYTCTVSAAGAQQFNVTRSSDAFVLATVAYTVPVPQVTLSFSNGAGVNGNLVITLEPARAPVTVNNFLSYVNSNFYGGTVIHRHSPAFVLQGGGFAGPLVAGGANPTPKPTNAAIMLEDNAGLSNVRLTVAMARTNAADSATSQFFINLASNTSLDRTAAARGYAVFGTITGGIDLVNTMVAAPCTAWAGFLFAGECLPSPNITLTSAVQTR